MKFRIVFGMLVLALGISSCSNLGSVVLPPDRLAYNRALMNSESEQVLLNIVRLRYSDPAYFLSVNNVVSQFSFGSNYSVNVANAMGPPSLLGSGNAGYNYSESPTITYTPLQGEDFIDRLLTPVDLNVIHMLFRSGWSVFHVSRVIIQRFGNLDNASLASRAVSGRIPVYKPFLEIISVFRHMQQTSGITITKDMIDNVFAIRMTFTDYKQLTARERLVLSKVGVTASSPNLWLVTGEAKAINQIQIETRAVIGLLHYLSKGVDVPPEDIANKKVRLTYYPDGRMFDWHDVTNGVFRVRSSKSKPIDAYVAVTYRGSWFYVPSNDFETKETLELLGIIMGIYQTKIQSSLPVFTVS
jgi:hypothetical protein